MTETVMGFSTLETRELINKSLGMASFPVSQRKCEVLGRALILKMQGFSMREIPSKIAEEFGKGWAEILDEFIVNYEEKRAA